MIKYDIGSKLRGLRLSRNLTLRSVAREIGFSIALLSQIEKNKISPPLATLSKLARFFDVTMSSLFVETEEKQKYEIIRKDDRDTFLDALQESKALTGYPQAAFLARMGNRKMTPFLMTLSEGNHCSTTWRSEGESFLFVLQGELKMLINTRELVLEEGDSIYFDASLEHKLFPPDGQQTVILEVTAGRK